MRRLLSILILSTFTLGLAGCGGSSGSADQAAAEGQGGEQAAGPDQTVFNFLEAVRTGEDAKAGEMLTDLALKKTREMDLVIAPEGSATARFSVGEVENVSDKEAFVACDWTDVTEQGQEHTDRIVWVLKQQPEGWRIAGMVTKFFEEQLILNFEDPEDMVRKQKLAEQEMIRRANEAAKQGIPGVQPAELPPEQQAKRPPAANAPLQR